MGSQWWPRRPGPTVPSSGPLGAGALDVWVLGAERHAGHPQREGCGPRGKQRGIGGEVQPNDTTSRGVSCVTAAAAQEGRDRVCWGAGPPPRGRHPQTRRPRSPGVAPSRASRGSCFSTSAQINYLPAGALYSHSRFTEDIEAQRGTCTKRAAGRGWGGI